MRCNWSYRKPRCVRLIWSLLELRRVRPVPTRHAAAAPPGPMPRHVALWTKRSAPRGRWVRLWHKAFGWKGVPCASCLLRVIWATLMPQGRGLIQHAQHGKHVACGARRYACMPHRMCVADRRVQRVENHA
jgi:hypothetical protein